jgi:phage I-like protein
MMCLVKQEVQLTPLKISNGALQVKGFPRRLKLLDWGVNQTVYGPVIVNETTAALLPMNQKKLGFDTIALDYEHNTVPKTPEFERTREPREIAANGVPLVVPGEGLFFDALEYTPSGKQNHMNYIDLSPTPKLSDKGEVVFLHSVALCRQGAVEGLHYYSVMLGVEDSQKANPQENSMNDLMAFLKKVFRLSDTATDDDVMKAFQSAVSMAPDGGGDPVPCSSRILALEAALLPLSALLAADGQLTTLSAGLEGLKTKVGDVDVKCKITALSSTLEGMQKDVMCFMARVAGKVVPLSAEDLAKTSIETLSGMIEKLPVTVPVAQLTPLSAGAGEGNVAPAIPESDAKIARACGMDPMKVFGNK